ncbi:hypothetical protein FFWV33_00505 [Flavobacterium faecale]|uniref:Uncharacterized protein n=1 Tax=Flavobacterium faecale TaxID=1355330 RepID=A0A2S1L8S2_9FLAO|nr:hypothetical protein [Flavobacterium faecale]AWG20104.1 hypothetical protein FFWV33_00505 [Flavobacterium faecale]
MKTKITLVASMLIIGTFAQAQIAEIKVAQNGITQLNKQEKELQLQKSCASNDIALLTDQEKKIKVEKLNLKNEIRYLKTIEVNPDTKLQFKEDFKSVSNADWSADTYYTCAKFNQNGQTLTAYYDNDSKLIGTTTAKKLSDLPLATQNSITNKYSDYKIKSVLYFNDNAASDSDLFMLDKQFNDTDCFFVILTNAKQKITLQLNDAGQIMNEKSTQDL